MGTRSLTTFIETSTDKESGKKRRTKIVTMYRQFDGYPSGHGLELAEFLAKGKLVNGIGMDAGVVFNGMGCLAAQVVAHFKDGAGGFYLEKARTKADWEDYTYEVIGDFNTHELTLITKDCSGKKLFKGTPQAFLESKLLKEA